MEINEVASADFPIAMDSLGTKGGKEAVFRLHVFQENPWGFMRIWGLGKTLEHAVLVYGEPKNGSLVRVHSECLTGDVFGSLRCDCGWQLHTALPQIAKEKGILIYLPQEGRGIGLTNKIKAYHLQSEGLDTVEANHKLGFLADHRYYGMSAQILQHLGVKQIQLLTNNPRKIEDLQKFGIDVIKRVPHESFPHENNVQYLKTKRDKMGHLLEKV